MRMQVAAAIFAASMVVPATMVGDTIGQIDTFQNGTTNGWFAGGITGGVPANPPTVVSNGGPGGTGDAYLRITAVGGDGPGSRLVAINSAQWTGNLLAAGIQGVAMDLRNFGNTALTIRLRVENPLMGPPTDEAVSNVGVTLAASGGWTHAFIPLSAANFTAVLGSPQAALSNTTFFRIIHAPTAGDAEPVVGVLGVDNITLVGVPEPSTMLMLAGGLGFIAFRRWRR